MSAIKWVYPSMEALGLVKIPNENNNGLTLKRKNKGANWPAEEIAMHVKSGYSFACCGAGELSSLSGTLINDNDLQETALALHNFFIEGAVTYYAVAATYQLNDTENNPRSLLQLLLTLGMKEVHKTPNRNHGPNDMHMLVLDPCKVDTEGITKAYFWREPSTDILLPKYVQTLSTKSQQALIDSWKQIQETTVIEEQTRIRDANERAWRDRVINIEQLFYHMNNDNFRKDLYKKRNVSNFVPQISDAVKQRLFKSLKQNGWSHANEQQQQSKPDISQSNSVGLTQNQFWEVYTVPVQKRE